MTAWLLRLFLGADALGLLVIVAALQVLVYGVSSSLRNTDTSSFFWICTAAALVGYGMGKGKWRGWQASAGIAALGVMFAWILGARLTQPLLSLLRAAFSILPQIVPAIQSKSAVDWTVLLEAWTVVAQASAMLTMRLQTWLMGFDASVQINDPLVRNIVWVLILWLCSAWMGWFAAKRNAAASMLPAMSLLAAVISYSEYRVESLWVMVILLLFLMGIWNYRNHTLQWLKQRIDFSDSIRIDNSQAVIFLTLAVGAFAFVTPSISWREILDTIRERRDKSEAAEMLGVQPPRGSGKPVATQLPSLPRDHLLTGGNANSEQIVMLIRTGELPPLANPSLPVAAPRYYWRSTVYDQYVGAGWVTSAIVPQTIAADTPLIPGLLTGYRLVHLDVEMVETEGRLFWSGTLFSVDTPFTANWRVRPPSDLFADQQALLQADLFAALTDAGTYQAETYVPTPTVNALRAAPADYPEQIRLYYLPLPRSVPERVLDLASDITRGLTTPYDKAKAIESYLRTNYPYDLAVPAPPADRDVADYFLFDLKKGYCDYYATSMVVLARASGLPARFVSGYAPGSYDAPNAQYIIRELNAHSWAEVYFPQIGWVEFEPTASLPEIERSEDILSMPLDQGNEETASDLLTRFRLERILLWSSPLLSALVFALLYVVFIDRWLVLRLPPETAIENVYQRFYRSARPIAGAWTRAETSSQFLRKLTSAIDMIGSQTRYRKLTEHIHADANALTDLYHSSLFTKRGTRKQDALLAWRTWKHLQRQLLGAKLLLRLMNIDLHLQGTMNNQS